ncbi:MULTISPECIES: hypothetical protein [unclassified Dehalobacter]|uniref:hypothetical protein n=1 Tax=unclassified Dehalobacter TaxID=2635733 RepID=UPI0003A6B9B0|nr:MULTISPECIES: hypothetical protein [unclassified Dehalobacter]RJE48974.1 hypothetical protein A7K50_07610 [Dehalobacter sp. MCB1]TCX51711.1 hypothetical protein C1I36_05110 [Dehalobacter sp. 14DCB1]TCX52771.1 hypothetical protein C1I38_06790 [Dehalobacter sp. 12DCB1]
MGQPAETKIIEFNGLAGCGKTTLARELKEELIRRGYRVILFGEAYHIFKEHPFKNIIRCFEWPLFLQYIRFFLVIGRKKENTLFIYWAALRISLIYRWCLKTGEYNFILCDHGLIQNIISLLGFDQLKHCERFNRCFTSILKAESKIYIVNCNVPIELSSKRIHIRKKNTGRLDVISNDLDLKKLLRITEINFIAVRNKVKTIQKEWPIIDLETDKPIQINIQRMLNLLSQRNQYE